MVNRDINFNRRKVKRLKTIRDLKKARINRKKQHLQINNDSNLPLTKKEEKRSRRLENIIKEFEDKNISLNNIFKDKHIRRRNRRKAGNKNNNSNMIIDNS